MEESASHHFINICFAQLRAEMGENDVFEARRSPEIIKNLKFWAPKIYNIKFSSFRFCV